jgi:membrane protease YdiL (CAAX protease family)
MSNWPLFQFVVDLEGFDLAAFLVGLAVVFFFIGFAIDYIVGRFGMGPYWNGFYALLGAYAGLCVRAWWLRPYSGYEPYLTTIAIAGGLLMTVVMACAVAKR